MTTLDFNYYVYIISNYEISFDFGCDVNCKHKVIRYRKGKIKFTETNAKPVLF